MMKYFEQTKSKRGLSNKSKDKASDNSTLSEFDKIKKNMTFTDDVEDLDKTDEVMMAQKLKKDTQAVAKVIMKQVMDKAIF